MKYLATSNTINDNVAGIIDIGYTYFVNEISNSGWNFGITPIITFSDYKYGSKNYDNEVGVLLNVGYQF